MTTNSVNSSLKLRSLFLPGKAQSQTGLQVRYKGDSQKADSVYDGMEPLTAAGKLSKDDDVKFDAYFTRLLLCSYREAIWQPKLLGK